MTVKEYQTIIEKTAVFPNDIGLAYCALGLVGEAGEVAEKIKKLYRDESLPPMLNPDLPEGFQNRTISITKDHENAIKKELGDVLWYLTATANQFSLSLEEIMEANYNKLIKRRQTNTLHGSGDDREEQVT